MSPARLSCWIASLSAAIVWIADSRPARADVAPVAPATVEVGDVAPTFESTDEYGRPWKSSQHVQRKTVVLYFYPGDFSPGCIRQAQNYRENLAALVEQGIKVVGISGDLPATHQLFRETYGLKFTLLSDSQGAVARQFGVPVGTGGKVRAHTADGEPLWDSDGKTIIISRPLTLARWILILDPTGKVAYKNTKVDPLTSAQEILQVIAELEKTSP